MSLLVRSYATDAWDDGGWGAASGATTNGCSASSPLESRREGGSGEGADSSDVSVGRWRRKRSKRRSEHEEKEDGNV